MTIATFPVNLGNAAGSRSVQRLGNTPILHKPPLHSSLMDAYPTRSDGPTSSYLELRWCTQIKTYSWDNAQVVLVGNKCDLEDERVVSTERGKQLADQLGLEFFETSAKENINVKAVFERLVDIICDKMSESLDADPTLVNNQSKSTRLSENTSTNNSSCSC
ncbi:Ras-related protein Rab-26 [Elysia marginata]|uniref:Ras-related protein Rab-26 n=1 Tax=Elysia marginata TaxID=1093978 RepID=A0AAV4IKU7_9GAST|nr:Ras-related protein Rab-26 [Elysia marginata]